MSTLSRVALPLVELGFVLSPVGSQSYLWDHILAVFALAVSDWEKVAPSLSNQF